MNLEFDLVLTDRMGMYTFYVVKLGEFADVYRSFVQTGMDDEDTQRRATWDFASQLHRVLSAEEET